MTSRQLRSQVDSMFQMLVFRNPLRENYFINTSLIFIDFHLKLKLEPV